MNELLEWALKYHKHGFSVIPVSRNKIPLVNWKDYQDKRADEVQIREWFDKPEPPNIGIVTGKISGITVVDVEKGGKWTDFPSTMMCATGGGGVHLYYVYAEGVGNSARIRELTDIRGNGGFVVAPPSLHSSGVKYEWTRKEGRQPFPFSMFNLKPEEKTDWQEILKGVSSGKRNQSAAKACGKILNAVNPAEWSTTAWEMLVIWNMRNEPPLQERELRAVFNSIVGLRVRAGQANPDPENPEEEIEIRLLSHIAKDLTDDMSTKYPTGFAEYDKAFRGGPKEGDVVFVSGFTGSGKTFFLQSVTYNMVKTGLPVLWFSFEVTLGELWRKFKDMGVDDEFQAYSPERTAIRHIDWIHKKIIEARDTYKTKVVFIDHLGFLVEDPKNYDKNLANNQSSILTMICRRLKSIAINEGIVIFLAGHLRKPAHGEANNPTLHDIKDSAGIAQEADSVVIIHRKKTGGRLGDSDAVYENQNYVKIEKNRAYGDNKVFSVTASGGRLIDASYGNNAADIDAAFNKF